jgi:hypothetical protein
VDGSSSFEKFLSEIVKFSDTQPRFSGFTQVPNPIPDTPATKRHISISLSGGKNLASGFV